MILLRRSNPCKLDVMSRKTRVFIVCSPFSITFIVCYAVAAQTAGKSVLPDSIGYVIGYPNDNALYVLFIFALISFGNGVFTLVRNKLVAVIITVIGTVLLGLATFLAGFF